MDGVEDRIENGRYARAFALPRPRGKRVEIAMRGRDRESGTRRFPRRSRACSRQAEQVIRAGQCRARLSSSRSAESTLTAKPAFLQRRARRPRDAGTAYRAGSRDRSRRRRPRAAPQPGRRSPRSSSRVASTISAKMRTAWRREVRRAARLAKMGGQVVQFVGPALEAARRIRSTSAARSARQRPGTMTRCGVERARQPAHEDRLGHQRRDLHADVEDRPVEGVRRHAAAAPFQPGRARDDRSGTGSLSVMPEFRRARRSIASRSSAIEFDGRRRPRNARGVREFSRSIGRG